MGDQYPTAADVLAAARSAWWELANEAAKDSLKVTEDLSRLGAKELRLLVLGGIANTVELARKIDEAAQGGSGAS